MRIVIVEDEAPIREGMKKILNKINPEYQVVGTACDGLQGLEIIQREKPDLVLMDIRMPDMDGLTMLEKLRKSGNHCKAIVLSAYSDFTYAQKAIELGIENYILKPVRIPELRRALEQTETTLAMEEKRDQPWTLNRVFGNALLDQWYLEEGIRETTEEKYGFSVDDTFSLFFVRLGERYGEYGGKVESLLKDVCNRGVTFKGDVVSSGAHRMVVLIIYSQEKKENLYDFFSTSVVPMLESQGIPNMVYDWEEAQGLSAMSQAMETYESHIQWNLIFPKGELLCGQKIEEAQVTPLKYSLELENQIKQAVSQHNMEKVLACAAAFKGQCTGKFHSPISIKEACIQFCWAIINTAREWGLMREDVSLKEILDKVSEAVTEEELDEAYHQLIAQLEFAPMDKEEQNTSLLVQRANHLITEFYSQGITLEEVARKLCVSAEYLSTQFKKETGATFSETLRKCKVDKVKELLSNSSLKLNQIASLTGYTDPKYMSKVFKEEVGMLPAEYRKMYS